MEDDAHGRRARSIQIGLKCSNGSPAGEAALERLAGGRAEGGEALGVRAAAARAGERRDARARPTKRIGTAPSARDRPGRRDAVGAQLARPSALIQSVVQAGARRSSTRAGPRPAAASAASTSARSPRSPGSRNRSASARPRARRRRARSRRARCRGRAPRRPALRDRARRRAPARRARVRDRRGGFAHHTPPGKLRCRCCISARM